MEVTDEVRDVGNSVAVSVLEELLREGQLTRAQVDLYRSKYAKLHELVLQTYEAEKLFLRKAKDLNHQLTTEKIRLERTTIEQSEDAAQIQTLNAQLKRTLAEYDAGSEREAMLQMQLSELEHEKRELEERLLEGERTPYSSAFLQECERMNLLLFEMGRSLLELDSGLKGDLSVSAAMESLMRALYDDRVPDSWASRAWPSLRPLGSWLLDMLHRQRQLAEWTTAMATPKVTWISGLFNPQAFLTAVMQVTARKNEWPLDKLATVVEVSKKLGPDEIDGATRDGAYIHGLYVEGARWDVGGGTLEEAVIKQLYPPMPVVLVKAATQDKMDARDIYPCPVYMTQQRGPTFVFTAGLKTKASATKWVLAGVALILDVVDV